MRLFDEIDFAEEMIDAIETKYGRPIERIAKFSDLGPYFKISIIFQDYCLLEAKIKVSDFSGVPSIHIEGFYY
jgi:hypothetical protein